MKSLVLIILLAHLAHAQQSLELGPLVLQAIRGLMEWQPRAHGYQYDYRSNEKKINSDGSLKEGHSVWVDFQFISNRRFGLLKERDGQPTTEQQRQEQLLKFTTNAGRQSSADMIARQKRKAEADRKRKEEFAFLEELPSAFDFKIVDRTKIGSRDISVVEFTPRAGYKPGQMRSKLFPKIRGKVWLDAGEGQAAKLTAEVFDDVSLGGFLANLGKGTHFEFEQNRVDDSRWLPVSIYSRVMARVLLFKTFNLEEVETFANYRKPSQ